MPVLEDEVPLEEVTPEDPALTVLVCWREGTGAFATAARSVRCATRAAAGMSEVTAARTARCRVRVGCQDARLTVPTTPIVVAGAAGRDCVCWFCGWSRRTVRARATPAAATTRMAIANLFAGRRRGGGVGSHPRIRMRALLPFVCAILMPIPPADSNSGNAANVTHRYGGLEREVWICR